MANFLDLPGEIRNKIYSHAHPTALVGLRGTNRQIRNETYDLAQPVRITSYTPSPWGPDRVSVTGKTAPSDYHLAKEIVYGRSIPDMRASWDRTDRLNELEAGGTPRRILDNYPVTYQAVANSIPQ